MIGSDKSGTRDRRALEYGQGGTTEAKFPPFRLNSRSLIVSKLGFMGPIVRADRRWQEGRSAGSILEEKQSGLN